MNGQKDKPKVRYAISELGFTVSPADTGKLKLSVI